MSERIDNAYQDISSFVCIVRSNIVEANNTLYDFLQQLGLHIITKEMGAIWTGSVSPFADQIIDEIFKHAQVIIILLECDEQVRLARDLIKDQQRKQETMFLFQPSLNVIFQAGYAFGRYPKQTILIRMGQSGLFSDIDGRYIVDFSGTKEECLRLLGLLISAGCTLNITENASRDLKSVSTIGISDILSVQNTSWSALTASHNDVSEDINNKSRKRERLISARKIFVVYGRNRHVKEAVFGFLRALDLSPIEWEKAIPFTGSGAPYIGQVLEVLLMQAQVVLVLLTGDDEVKRKNRHTGSKSQIIFQPRPNVV